MGYYPEFAELLIAYLRNQDRTASWLAHQLAIHPGTVGRWLNQGTRPGSPELIVRIADLLGVFSSEERHAFLIAAGYGYQEKNKVQASLSEQIQGNQLLAVTSELHLISAPKHNLPLSLTPLIGRASELTRLSQLLNEPALRLITLVGPGGIGKTHLALEVAAAHIPQFKDGVYLISLAQLHAVESLVGAIAEALGFSFYDQSPPEQQLRNYLAQKQILLLMDNFEHLLDGAALLISLLQTAPNLKILATSRTPLQIQGEQLYYLEGLAYPNESELAERGDISSDLQYGALSLFTHNARLLRSDFALTDENLPHVIRICRLVSGTPLALVLAATWIKMLSVDEIATEIEHNFAFLQADLQSLPARQHSLQAVFNHSWNLLSGREQEILVQLSVFRGGFDGQAAQAVTEAELADLLALVEKSLLHRTLAGRYAIHELLRQFAVQKLQDNPQKEQSAWMGHSAYYMRFLAQRGADLKGRQQKEALTEIQQAHENIRVAWEWAIEQQQLEYLDQAIDCLGYFYLWRAYYQDGETACRITTSQLSGHQAREAKRILVKAWLWQAIFNRHLGHNQLAGQLVKQSLNLLDEIVLTDQDLRAERAAILLEIGQQTGDLADANDWFDQALILYRTLEDSWNIAQTLYLLGNTLILQAGRYDEGQQALAESLQLRQNLGDQRGIAETIQSLGFSAALRGQSEISEPMLRQSLTIHRELDDKAAIADDLLSLAHDLGQNQGRFDEAYTLLEEASMLTQDLGLLSLLAVIKGSLSWIVRHQGHYDAAYNLGEICLGLGRELNEPSVTSYGLWMLGSIAIARKDYAEAEALLTESMTIHQEISFHDRLQGVRVSLGYALLGLKKADQAQACLIDPIRASLANRSLITQLSALPLGALIKSLRGETERAVELYALVSRYPFVANSRWFADVVGRHIASTAEQLPPDIVKVAQERGQVRDLWETAEELLAELNQS